MNDLDGEGGGFEVRVAQTEEEVIAHHRLRYEVYVEEMHSVEPAALAIRDRRERLERDRYDQHSVKFIGIDRLTNETVAAVRLIPETPLGFLMEQRFILPDDIDRKRTVELSRFALRRLRRNGGSISTRNSMLGRHDLLRPLYYWLLKNGITTCCAALQQSLLYAFLKDKVSFTLVGEPIADYHNTAVAPVVLYDIQAAVRRLWSLNQPLHLRYTGGRMVLPCAQDRTEFYRDQMEQDQYKLRLARRSRRHHGRSNET